MIMIIIQITDAEKSSNENKNTIHNYTNINLNKLFRYTTSHSFLICSLLVSHTNINLLVHITEFLMGIARIMMISKEAPHQIHGKQQ